MNNSEYTYRRAAAKKRSDRRRRNRQMTVKSLRMVIICSILIFAVSIGGIIVKASDDSNRTRTYKYYTTVSVEDNDTLGSILIIAFSWILGISTFIVGFKLIIS